MKGLLVLAFIVGVAVGGCGSSKAIVDGQCLGDLSSVFTPNDTTISVGQQFTAHVALFACGSKTAANTFSWASQDSTVVRVDMSTGVVTAVGKGNTRLTAKGPDGAFGGLPIAVQ
jgi:hypothetical protein